MVLVRPPKMRPFSSLLTFSLLHSVLLVSGRWETGDLDGDIPRPTPDPLLYRDDFKHGAILMETRPGRERNGTARRDLTLGPRQVWDSFWGTGVVLMRRSGYL